MIKGFDLTIDKAIKGRAKPKSIYSFKAHIILYSNFQSDHKAKEFLPFIKIFLTYSSLYWLNLATMEINIKLLVKQIAYQENKKSFERLFFHFYDLLYSFAYGYLQNREASEEVISDVFLTIWQKRKTLPHIHNIKVYLYVTVKNQAINYKKKYGRNPLLSVNEVPLFDVWQAENPESQLLTKELKKEIDDAIDSLPNRCKVIFQLIRIDGLKYREVAEVLNISVKTVEKQVEIAIQKLASKLHHLQVHKTHSKIKTGIKILAIISLILAMF